MVLNSSGAGGVVGLEVLNGTARESVVGALGVGDEEDFVEAVGDDDAHFNAVGVSARAWLADLLCAGEGGCLF